MQIGLPLAPETRVYAGFAVYSFGLGNIFPRLPDIQHAMAVEEGALGLGLIESWIGGFFEIVWQEAAVFVIMIAVLFVRPDGLFGRIGS